ncbi:hypothetical protein [Thioclava sp. F34-6]|uniref:hypothetical protein n=1 Tax=Thioclava sp. F34-6 TaxID=1973003 RepID=UPI0011BAA8E9|nr:hypothetical protein [Thioclava sp. F34-6]
MSFEDNDYGISDQIKRLEKGMTREPLAVTILLIAASYFYGDQLSGGSKALIVAIAVATVFVFVEIRGMRLDALRVERRRLIERHAAQDFELEEGV